MILLSCNLIAFFEILGMAQAGPLKTGPVRIEVRQMLEITIEKVRLLNQVPIISRSGKVFETGDICTLYRSGGTFVEQIVEGVVLLKYHASAEPADDECPRDAVTQYSLKDLVYLVTQRDAKDAETKFLEEFKEYAYRLRHLKGLQQ